MWHNDLCFPGQERLAEHMGTHVATVSRAIKDSEECSLVEIEGAAKERRTSIPLNFVVKRKSRKSEVAPVQV